MASLETNALRPDSDIRNHHRKRTPSTATANRSCGRSLRQFAVFQGPLETGHYRTDVLLWFRSPDRIVSGINRIGGPCYVDNPDLSWEEKYLDLGALNAPRGC